MLVRLRRRTATEVSLTLVTLMPLRQLLLLGNKIELYVNLRIGDKPPTTCYASILLTTFIENQEKTKTIP